MPYLQRALERYLEKNHTKAQLEGDAKLANGAVGKIMRGQVPRADTMANILAAVDDSTARDFLTSYLMDVCPEDFRKRLNVVVNPSDGKAVKETAAMYAGQSLDSFEEALAWLREEGQHNADIAKHVVTLVSLLRPAPKGG